MERASDRHMQCETEQRCQLLLLCYRDYNRLCPSNYACDPPVEYPDEAQSQDFGDAYAWNGCLVSTLNFQLCVEITTLLPPFINST
jgi:hypothetical protein